MASASTSTSTPTSALQCVLDFFNVLLKDKSFTWIYNNKRPELLPPVFGFSRLLLTGEAVMSDLYSGLPESISIFELISMLEFTTNDRYQIVKPARCGLMGGAADRCTKEAFARSVHIEGLGRCLTLEEKELVLVFCASHAGYTIEAIKALIQRTSQCPAAV